MSHQQHADNVEGITPYCRDTCKHEQVQQMFDNIAASYDLRHVPPMAAQSRI